MTASTGIWAVQDNKQATNAIITCSYLFVCSFAITVSLILYTITILVVLCSWNALTGCNANRWALSVGRILLSKFTS
jgi:hypothetical protein